MDSLDRVGVWFGHGSEEEGVSWMTSGFQVYSVG